MKTLLISLSFFLMLGCAATKIVLPTEPHFNPVSLYEGPDGSLCMDRESLIGLQKNLTELHKYQMELLRLLKEK